MLFLNYIYIYIYTYIYICNVYLFLSLEFFEIIIVIISPPFFFSSSFVIDRAKTLLWLVAPQFVFSERKKKRQEKNSHSNHYFGYWFDFFFYYSFLYHLFIFRCCCFNESTESAYPLYSQHKLVNLMKIGERKKLINGLNKLHKTGRFFKASIMGGKTNKPTKETKEKEKQIGERMIIIIHLVARSPPRWRRYSRNVHSTSLTQFLLASF